MRFLGEELLLFDVGLWPITLYTATKPIRSL
jgi:hypothetical protein